MNGTTFHKWWNPRCVIIPTTRSSELRSCYIQCIIFKSYTISIIICSVSSIPIGKGCWWFYWSLLLRFVDYNPSAKRFENLSLANPLLRKRFIPVFSSIYTYITQAQCLMYELLYYAFSSGLLFSRAFMITRYHSKHTHWQPSSVNRFFK